MVTFVTQPSPVRPTVEENRLPTVEFNTWVQTITDRALIIGTGSPEGVVSAIQGAEYMDDAGTAGNIRWTKRDNDDGLGDTTKGWIAD